MKGSTSKNARKNITARRAAQQHDGKNVVQTPIQIPKSESSVINALIEKRIPITREEIAKRLLEENAVTSERPFPNYVVASPESGEGYVIGKPDLCAIPVSDYGCFPFPKHLLEGAFENEEFAEKTKVKINMFMAANPLLSSFSTLVRPLMVLASGSPSSLHAEQLRAYMTKIEEESKNLRDANGVVVDKEKATRLIELYKTARNELETFTEKNEKYVERAWYLYQGTFDIIYFYMQIKNMVTISSMLKNNMQPAEQRAARERISEAEKRFVVELRASENLFLNESKSLLYRFEKEYARWGSSSRVQLSEDERRHVQEHSVLYTMKMIISLENWILNVFGVPQDLQPLFIGYSGDGMHSLHDPVKRTQQMINLQSYRTFKMPVDWRNSSITELKRHLEEELKHGCLQTENSSLLTYGSNSYLSDVVYAVCSIQKRWTGVQANTSEFDKHCRIISKKATSEDCYISGELPYKWTLINPQDDKQLEIYCYD